MDPTGFIPLPAPENPRCPIARSSSATAST
jgi:hypothetical protein